ncbi:MAG: hypothetical protein WCJ61_10040 [Paludibacter sp.]
MNSRAIKYIFTFLFAAYFLLAGVGYNVVSYCCQYCENEGIEVVATSSCNSLHQHSNSVPAEYQKDDLTCADVHHTPSGCHLLRLNIDVPSIQSTPELLVNPQTINDLFCTSINLLSSKQVLIFQNAIHPPNGFLLSSGRDIITYHAVFLI